MAVVLLHREERRSEHCDHRDRQNARAEEVSNHLGFHENPDAQTVRPSREAVDWLCIHQRIVGRRGHYLNGPCFVCSGFTQVKFGNRSNGMEAGSDAYVSM